MEKVLILIEAERYENCPHPEVGTLLPDGWTVLPVDSSLWLPKGSRKLCQMWLRMVADTIRAHGG